MKDQFSNYITKEQNFFKFKNLLFYLALMAETWPQTKKTSCGQFFSALMKTSLKNFCNFRTLETFLVSCMIYSLKLHAKFAEILKTCHRLLQSISCGLMLNFKVLKVSTLELHSITLSTRILIVVHIMFCFCNLCTILLSLYSSYYTYLIICILCLFIIKWQFLSI